MPRINGVVGPMPRAQAERHAAAMSLAVESKAENLASFEQDGIAHGLSAAQVASNPRCDVAFDGWIFNRGDFTDSENDARVVMTLYERHGLEGALAQLNGDFALALYDKDRRTLHLARDRFGIKPLYYATVQGGLAFSSRPRSLIALPGVSAQPDSQYVGLYAGSHYRTFDNAPDKSPFRDIRQLPGAHFLSFRAGKSEVRRYWSLAAEPEFTSPQQDLAARYRDLLANAVALRTSRARKPVFTLSGGMDSSSVLACAVMVSGRKQDAISTTYVDKTYDESEEIRSMLASSVGNWIKVEVDDPDIFTLVPEIIRQHDEPIATATWLSHYLLCRKAAGLGYQSLFGGLGGDELNAGEYEHFFYFFADLRRAGLHERLAHEIRFWIQHHDHPVFRKSRELVDTQLAAVTSPRAGVCLADRGRIERYKGAVDPAFFDVERFSPVMDNPFPSYLKNRTYQDIVRETVPCCLRAEDRQTAAFGLDNFLPFLDYRLVEFMFRIPSTLKYDRGVTKSLLREAMRGVLPEETRTRVKKTGWNAPAHRWFSGAGRQALLQLVRSPSFRQRGIYRLPEVERLIREHDEIVARGLNQDNHMMFLWQLVNLELWLQQIEGWKKPVP